MLKKFFEIFTKKETEEKKRPTTLRLAVEKGYVTEEQACDYEDEMNTGDLDLEETHTDLMVDRDLITESQADVLAFDMKKVDPEQALADRFKEASKAMEQNKETAEAVGTKTQGIRLAAVQAAKNEG